jgi:hypothetical protein
MRPLFQAQLFHNEDRKQRFITGPTGRIEIDKPPSRQQDRNVLIKVLISFRAELIVQ